MNGCSIAPSFDSIPALSNARVSLTSNPFDVYSNQDSVILQFDFTDGDGDVGYGGDDPRYISYDTVIVDTFIVDTVTGDTSLTFARVDVTTLAHVFLIRPYFEDTSTFYRIPRIPSNGGVPDISGTVTITLFASLLELPCVTNDPPPIDELTYSIYIEDRAFNKSNTIFFSPIPLKCQ